MDWILGLLQNLVNLVFLAVIVLTCVGTYMAYRMYAKRNVDFPWQKPAQVLGVEILAWILFSIFWAWFRANFWVILIIVLIIVYILSRKKKS